MAAPVIASQLRPDRNDILRARGLSVIDVGQGAPTHLDPGVSVLFATPFSWLDAPRPDGWPFGLKWVQLASVGIDHFPDWLFEVPLVTAAKGVTAEAVAEFAVTCVFAAAKRLPESWVSGAEAWTWRDAERISGSTLGVFGYGHIGKIVAARGQAFGMKVLAARRSVAAAVDGVEFVDGLEALIARSDHLVICAPSTAATRHVVNSQALAKAKPGLHLVNVARGALIDQDALIAALDAGRIRLASLDVTEPEPLPPGHRLYSHPGVRLSPHVSFLTRDLGARLSAAFIDNLEHFQAGTPLSGVVDLGAEY